MWLALGVGLSIAGVGKAAEGWMTDYEQGITEAQKGKRMALVEFTGSDWCPPCQYVRAKILPTPEFEAFVKDNRLVLIELDFPRDQAKVTPEQRKARANVAARYEIQGYPTMILMGGSGIPYGEVVGARPSKEAYIAPLQDALNVGRNFEAKVAAAASLSGVEKAKALLDALNTLPKKSLRFCSEIEQEIIANDPEDTLGVRSDIKQRELFETQAKEMQAMQSAAMEGVSREEGIQRVRAASIEMLKRSDLHPRIRQMLLMVVSVTYQQDKQLTEALEYAKKAIEADPNAEDIADIRNYQAALEKEIARQK